MDTVVKSQHFAVGTFVRMDRNRRGEVLAHLQCHEGHKALRVKWDDGPTELILNPYCLQWEK